MIPATMATEIGNLSTLRQETSNGSKFSLLKISTAVLLHSLCDEQIIYSYQIHDTTLQLRCNSCGTLHHLMVGGELEALSFVLTGILKYTNIIFIPDMFRHCHNVIFSRMRKTITILNI